jgi:hypothetical protein
MFGCLLTYLMCVLGHEINSLKSIYSACAPRKSHRILGRSETRVANSKSAQCVVCQSLYGLSLCSVVAEFLK